MQPQCKPPKLQLGTGRQTQHCALHSQLSSIWVFRHTLLHSLTVPSPHLICPALASKINLSYLPVTLPLLCSDQAPSCRCCDVVVGDQFASNHTITNSFAVHRYTTQKKQLLKQSHMAKQSSLINRGNIKKLQKVFQKVFYPVRHRNSKSKSPVLWQTGLWYCNQCNSDVSLLKISPFSHSLWALRTIS